MIMTVKAITIAKASDATPYLRAKALARATTTEVWTEGIPPLHRERLASHFPVVYFTVSPLIITAATKERAGIKITLL